MSENGAFRVASCLSEVLSVLLLLEMECREKNF